MNYLKDLRKIVIARHGAYTGSSRENDERLRDFGIEDINRLSTVIKVLLGEENTLVLSSIAPRAIESTDILVQNLGDLVVGRENIEYLWSGTDTPRESKTYFRDSYNSNVNQNEELLNIIQAEMKKAKVNGEYENRPHALILMTHLEVCRDFSRYFLEKGFDIHLNFSGVDKGQAYFVNIMNREHIKIP